MADAFASLLGIYTTQFTLQWQSTVLRAPYAFRTPDTVKGVSDTLSALKALAGQADALIGQLANQALSPEQAKADVANLNTLIPAQVAAVNSALDGLEGLDQNHLNKAAMLDHPALRKLAAELVSSADRDLRTNLEGFVERVGAVLSAAVPKPTAKPQTDPKPDPEPQEQPKDQPKDDPKEDPKDDPKDKPMPDPDPDPKPAPTPAPDVHPAPTPSAAPSPENPNEFGNLPFASDLDDTAHIPDVPEWIDTGAEDDSDDGDFEPDVPEWDAPHHDAATDDT